MVVVVVALLDDFSSNAPRAFVAVVIIIIEEEEEEKVDFSPPLSFLETRSRKRILSDLDEEQDEEETEEEEERRNDFAPRRAKSMCRAKSLSLSLSVVVCVKKCQFSLTNSSLFSLLESFAICAMHIHALQR